MKRGSLALVPASLGMAYAAGAGSPWTFVTAVAAIVPLAQWIRRATEHLAARAGPGVGGLLNVSFGNAAEFAIALNVLQTGKNDVVKAQITGWIIGNGLLGLGLAIIAGSVGRSKQEFNRARAGQLSSLLLLSVIALLIPALFDFTGAWRGSTQHHAGAEALSISVSVVLIVVYLANPGFRTFLRYVLEHDLVERQVGDEPFQLGVFVAQLLQLAGFTGQHPAVDLLPAVERLLGDPDLATDVADRHALRDLLQHRR